MITDLRNWLELERLEYEGEIEIRRKALDERIKQVKSDYARRGMHESDSAARAVNEARDCYLRALILNRIAIRKKLAEDVPDLLCDIELDSLQEKLERTVQAGVQADCDEALRQNLAAGRTIVRRSEHEVQAERSGQVALIHREISKLRLKKGLGMDKRRESHIVLSINNSTVSGLNLGSVLGNMNASLTTLEQQGNADLARALKTLSEEIVLNEQLGAERRELLENISVLGEQGKLPIQERRMGVVKAAYRYLREAVAVGGSTAAIWGTWGPQIESFFGLSH